MNYSKFSPILNVESVPKQGPISGEVAIRKQEIVPTAIRKRNDNIRSKVNFVTDDKLLHLLQSEEKCVLIFFVAKLESEGI